MSGGKHGDDDGDGLINRLDPDAAAYEGAVGAQDALVDARRAGQAFVDELGGIHGADFDVEHAYEFPDPGWRPESDFTGEWVEQHVARLPRGAAPRTGVTAATLRAAMGADLPLGRHPTLVADFNAALLAAGATTVNRAAMFAAQVGHESLGLRYFEELWGPTAQQRKYEPPTDLARQLGNTAPRDGSRFRGRGPIQLTGRGGYTAFLAWCRARGLGPPDFLRDPAQVATSRWGFLAASHYWTVRRPRINGLCDAGDLDGVTRQINGGTYGIDDRRRRWQACLRLGSALLPATANPTAPAGPDPATARRRRQQALILGDPMERPFGPGDSNHRIVCPTGKASKIVASSWLSASVQGNARVDVWAQVEAEGAATPAGAGPADKAERHWTLYGGDRPWFELPSGTEMVTVQVRGATGFGSISIEQLAA